MHKLFSIVLLGVFLLLQANRFTLYMGCRLTSIYTATVCDCDDIIAEPGNTPLGEQSSAGFTIVQPDEFYELPANPFPQVLPEPYEGLSSFQYGKRQPGHLRQCFHPPATFS